jgi:hypothetical protein
MSINRNQVAKTVRENKEKHPEYYCGVPNCLWRTQTRGGYKPCGNHQTAIVRSATVSHVYSHNGLSYAYHGTITSCDGCSTEALCAGFTDPKNSGAGTWTFLCSHCSVDNMIPSGWVVGLSCTECEEEADKISTLKEKINGV